MINVFSDYSGKTPECWLGLAKVLLMALLFKFNPNLNTSTPVLLFVYFKSTLVQIQFINQGVRLTV